MTTMPKNKSANARTAKNNVAKRLATHEYPIRRTYQAVVATSATDIGRAANFISLSAVPDVADFTTLFDQFTIDRIEVHFVCNRAAQSAGNSAILPTLLYAQDLNDSTAPTVIGDVLAYDTMQLFQFSESNRHVRFELRPKVQQAVTTGTAITAGPAWCSTSSASTTPWYGFKFWLVDYNSTSTTGSVVTLYLTYHMRFKAPK